MVDDQEVLLAATFRRELDAALETVAWTASPRTPSRRRRRVAGTTAGVAIAAAGALALAISGSGSTRNERASSSGAASTSASSPAVVSGVVVNYVPAGFNQLGSQVTKPTAGGFSWAQLAFSSDDATTVGSSGHVFIVIVESGPGINPDPNGAPAIPLVADELDGETQSEVSRFLGDGLRVVVVGHGVTQADLKLTLDGLSKSS